MRASRGKALIGDVPARRARQSVGVVSHTTFLYDELTALENLRLYATLYGVANPSVRTLVLLEAVGMAHLADVLVGRLSRGQQQRVTIARALLHDPPVLMLDEPDTGLDVAAFGFIEALLCDSRRTMVVTTHNLATGLRLCTRAAILARGRLVYQQSAVSRDDAADLGNRLERLAE
jgi:heme exporter protein A